MTRHFRQIFLLLGLVFSCSASLINNEKVVHEAVLDPDGNYVMLWSPKEDEIVFELQVRFYLFM